MDLDTNRAIALYRRLKVKEWEIGREEAELHNTIRAFNIEQFNDYAQATMDIDRVMDETQRIINASHYAFSTEKQMMHQAANRTGMEKV